MTERPRGSFGMPKEAVEAGIREQRAAEALESQTKEIAKERVENRKKEQEAQVESQLPAKVQSGLLGTVPFSQFKEHYKDIWEQIQDKDHLLTQRVVHESKMAQIPVKIQSLKRREEQALVSLEPTPVGYPRRVMGADGKYEMVETTPQDRVNQQLSYMTYRMVVQIVHLGGATFPSLKLTPDTQADWLEDTAVQQAYEYLMDLDPVMFQYLISLVEDVDNAKHFALVENMKNPLALRSPTTD